jgi:hypothetical protein
MDSKEERVMQHIMQTSVSAVRSRANAALEYRPLGKRLVRWLCRHGWDVVKVFLVVLTTLFFLLQSQCRQELWINEGNLQGACNLVKPTLQQSQASQRGTVAWYP